MFRLSRYSIVALAITTWQAGCRPDPNKPIASPDSYVLFVPSGDSSKTGGSLQVERATLNTDAVQPVPKLLETGFASEMLRTVYLAGWYLRDATIDGKRFQDLAQANGRLPVSLVVGVDKMPYARGLSIKGSWGSAIEKPTQPWIGIPGGDLTRDKALIQTLTARFASYAAHLVATGGLLDAAPEPPQSLVEGYRMAMEVVAREWRHTEGPAGVIQVEEGTPQQRALFGDVRDNRYILDETKLGLLSAPKLLDSPGVAATVIYRMAQSRAVGHKVAPATFYVPFAANRMPPGVNPAAILGTFRNSQAKLLGVWAGAVLRGKAPKDIVDLIESYGAEFPAERAEAIRIFVVTTFGGTVKLGGSSMKPADARYTQAELTALAAEVVAGRRTLRDALRPNPPQPEK